MQRAKNSIDQPKGEVDFGDKLPVKGNRLAKGARYFALLAPFADAVPS